MPNSGLSLLQGATRCFYNCPGRALFCQVGLRSASTTPFLHVQVIHCPRCPKILRTVRTGYMNSKGPKLCVFKVRVRFVSHQQSNIASILYWFSAEGSPFWFTNVSHEWLLVKSASFPKLGGSADANAAELWRWPWWWSGWAHLARETRDTGSDLLPCRRSSAFSQWSGALLG